MATTFKRHADTGCPASGKSGYHQCKDTTRIENSTDIINQGNSIASGLADNPYLPDDVKQLLHTGEESGRLEQMLELSTQQQIEALNSVEEQFAEWLPQIVYFLVLLGLGTNIVSTPIAPAL